MITQFKEYLERKNIDSKEVPKHVYDYIEEQIIKPLFAKIAKTAKENKELEFKNRRLLEVIDQLTTEVGRKCSESV